MEGHKIKVFLIRETGGNAAWEKGFLSRIGDKGVEFIHLTGLEEAQRAIGQMAPDVIAVDLPGQDSLPFFLEVHYLAPTVPSIVLTDKADPKLSFRAIQEGAEDCLVKNESDADSLGRRLVFAVRRQVLLKRLRVLSNVEVKPNDMAAARKRLAEASEATIEIVMISRLATLEEAEARLAASPGDWEAHFYRARLLAELGRVSEAGEAYGKVLELPLPDPAGKADPDGFFLTAYQEALKHHPGHVRGRLHLAGLLRAKGKIQAARDEYETVLRLEPACGEARKAVDLLSRPDGEDPPRQAGVPLRRRASQPLPVLLLASTVDGNGPFPKILDDGTFLTSLLVTDFYDPDPPLPPHRLVVNSIGDADLCRPALRTAQGILARSRAPIVNPPSRVLGTGRVDNAVRLRGVPGVITPGIVNLPKGLLAKPGSYDEIARRGFSYPFLLRSPGYHLGRYFRLISNERDLALAAAALPGPTLSVIRYLDGRGKDGKMRKYRVMMIDGGLYPAHLALSGHWKVHYFTADMDDHPENRAEDEAFLGDMRSTIGEKAFRAIEAIREMLALDYAGIDFGLDGEGNLLLYEANACMNVTSPGPDPRWDYRRRPVERILEATRQMIHKKAG